MKEMFNLSDELFAKMWLFIDLVFRKIIKYYYKSDIWNMFL